MREYGGSGSAGTSAALIGLANISILNYCNLDPNNLILVNLLNHDHPRITI
jgi:hypothetical protein